MGVLDKYQIATIEDSKETSGVLSKYGIPKLDLGVEEEEQPSLLSKTGTFLKEALAPPPGPSVLEVAARGAVGPNVFPKTEAEYMGPSPRDILAQVLEANPGLKKTHSLEDTDVILASPERTKIGSKMGGLEYWPSDETGIPGWEHPTEGGKNVVEVYSDELRNNPELLRKAVYGDLIHGMSRDPEWTKLREEFKQNYTPEEMKRIAAKKSWWEDVNGKDANEIAIHDAYIRGYLNEPSIAQRGQETFSNTMYSPKQLEILGKMQKYIKTGSTEEPSFEGLLKRSAAQFVNTATGQLPQAGMVIASGKDLEPGQTLNDIFFPDKWNPEKAVKWEKLGTMAAQGAAYLTPLKRVSAPAMALAFSTKVLKKAFPQLSNALAKTTARRVATGIVREAVQFGTAATTEQLGNILTAPTLEGKIKTATQAYVSGARMGGAVGLARGAFPFNRLMRIAVGTALLTPVPGTDTSKQMDFYDRVGNAIFTTMMVWHGYPATLTKMEADTNKKLKEQGLEKSAKTVAEEILKGKEATEAPTVTPSAEGVGGVFSEKNPETGKYRVSDTALKEMSESVPSAKAELERRTTEKAIVTEKIEVTKRRTQDKVYLDKAKELKKLLGKDVYYQVLQDLGLTKSNQAFKSADKQRVLKTLMDNVIPMDMNNVELAKWLEERPEKRAVVEKRLAQLDAIAKEKVAKKPEEVEKVKREAAQAVLDAQKLRESLDKKTVEIFEEKIKPKEEVPKTTEERLEEKLTVIRETPEYKAKEEELRKKGEELQRKTEEKIQDIKRQREPIEELPPDEDLEFERQYREEMDKLSIDDLEAMRDAARSIDPTQADIVQAEIDRRNTVAEKPEQELTSEEKIDVVTKPATYGKKITIEEARKNPLKTLQKTQKKLQKVSTGKANIDDVIEDLNKAISLTREDFPDFETFQKHNEAANKMLEVARKVQSEQEKVDIEEAQQPYGLQEVLELDPAEVVREPVEGEPYEKPTGDRAPLLFDIGGATGEGLRRVYESATKKLRELPSIENLRTISRGIFLEGKQKYGEFRSRMKEIVGDLWNDVKGLVRQAYNEAKKWKIFTDERGMVVWHGTKSKFDKFKNEFIGSGEGAQMKGWGHYFTSKKKVGEWYAKSIGRNIDITINGKDASEFLEDGKLRYIKNEAYLSLPASKERNEYIRDHINRWIKEETKKLEYIKTLENNKLATPGYINETVDVINKLKEASKGIIDTTSSRVLHEVKLPEDAEWLDLDKPAPSNKCEAIAKEIVKEVSSGEISKQNLQHLDATRLVDQLRDQAKLPSEVRDFVKMTGEDIQSELIYGIGKEKTSKLLLKAGIPGNTYIGASSGERNYVVFDENLPEIVGTTTLDMLGLQQLSEFVSKRLFKTETADAKLTREYIERARKNEPPATQLDIQDLKGLGNMKGFTEKDVRKIASNSIRYVKDLSELTFKEAQLLKAKLMSIENIVLESEREILNNPDISQKVKEELRKGVNRYEVSEDALSDFIENSKLDLNSDILTDAHVNRVIADLQRFYETRPSEDVLGVAKWLLPMRRRAGDEVMRPYRTAMVRWIEGLRVGDELDREIFDTLDKAIRNNPNIPRRQRKKYVTDALKRISLAQRLELPISELSPLELDAFNKLNKVYNYLYDKYDIQAPKREPYYSPKRTPEENRKAAIRYSFSPRGVKELEFWADFREAFEGGLVDTELDARKLFNEYYRRGLKTRVFNEAIKEAAPIEKKMSPDKQELVKEFFNVAVMRRPMGVDKAKDRSVKNLAKKLWMKEDEGSKILRQVEDILLNASYAAYLGAAPRPALRDSLQQWLIVNKYGIEAYARGVMHSRSQEIKDAMADSPMAKLRLSQFLVEELPIHGFSELPRKIRDQLMVAYKYIDLGGAVNGFSTGYYEAKTSRPRLPRSYWIRAGEKAMANTAWLYGIDLPMIMQGRTGKLGLQFSSWSLSYIDHLMSMVRERDGKAAARTAGQFLVFWALNKFTGIDYKSSILLGAMPNNFGYVPNLVWDFIQLLRAIQSGRNLDSTWDSFKERLGGLVPGFRGIKDIKKLSETGNLKEYLFYTRKTKKPNGLDSGLGGLGEGLGEGL